MDCAPIWTDLKTFPWAEFRDRVDILTGGYPCQPFSAAGKRLGTEDPRHLWPFIADGIRILRPKLCFFENVEGHISLGLREVIGELGAIGYQTAWGIFSASEVGAPHQRKRVFILAYDQSVGIQGCGASWLQEPSAHAGQTLPLRRGDAGGLADANHKHGHGEERRWNPEAQGVPSEHWQEEHSRREPWGTNAAPAWPSRPGEPQHAWEPPRVVANGHGRGQRECCKQDSIEIGLNQQSSQRNNACGCNEAMGNAEQFLLPATREHGAMDEASGIPTDRKGSEPAQTDPIAGATRKREGDGRDASECSEIESPVGRDAHGPTRGMDYAELCVTCDNRTDELRLLGNGVVPATATRAFLTLWEELFQQQPTN